MPEEQAMMPIRTRKHHSTQHRYQQQESYSTRAELKTNNKRLSRQHEQNPILKLMRGQLVLTSCTPSSKHCMFCATGSLHELGLGAPKFCKPRQVLSGYVTPASQPLRLCPMAEMAKLNSHQQYKSASAPGPTRFQLQAKSLNYL